MGAGRALVSQDRWRRMLSLIIPNLPADMTERSATSQFAYTRDHRLR